MSQNNAVIIRSVWEAQVLLTCSLLTYGWSMKLSAVGLLDRASVCWFTWPCFSLFKVYLTVPLFVGLLDRASVSCWFTWLVPLFVGLLDRASVCVSICWFTWPCLCLLVYSTLLLFVCLFVGYLTIMSSCCSSDQCLHFVFWDNRQFPSTLF